MRARNLCSVGMLLLITVSSFAIWSTPENGWDVDYQASSGVLPQGPLPWAYSTYNNPSSGGNGLATLSGSILTMEHDAACTDLFARTGGDDGEKILMELKLRLADNTQADNKMQFAIQIRRVTDDGVRLWVYRFARSAVSYSNDNAIKQKSFAFGSDWRTVRLIIDSEQEKSWMFVDGSNTPVCVGYEAQVIASGDNRIYFGDGSADVAGITELEYIRWTAIDAIPEIWDVVYDASTGSLPASPWATNYNNDSAEGPGKAVIKDGALELDNRTTTAQVFDNYSYIIPADTLAPGSSYRKSVSTEFKFRLTDTTKSGTQQQLSTLAAFNTASGIKYWTLRFAMNELKYTRGMSGNWQTVPYNFGTGWHTARWVIDVESQIHTLYISDANEPLFEEPLYISKLGLNSTVSDRITFGDGTSDVNGVAQIQYFKVSLDRQLPDGPKTYKWITHQGDKNPVTNEGWSTESGGTNWDVTGEVSGQDAWWLVDDYGSDSRINYLSPAIADPTPGVVSIFPDATKSIGWTFTTVASIVNSSPFPEAVAGAVFSFAEKSFWYLALVKDADPKVSGLYYRNAAGEFVAVHNVDVTIPHTYQIVYDPSGNLGDGTATIYIDGAPFKTLTRDMVPQNIYTYRVRFGSISSAAITSSRWYYVALESGQNPVDNTYLFSCDDFSSYQAGDFNNDCKVDEADLYTFANNWLGQTQTFAPTNQMNGINLTISEPTVILTDNNEHLNFPKVFKASDDVVWYIYAIGQHTVTERHKRLWSTDKAATWIPTAVATQAYNNAFLADGRIIGTSCWDAAITNTHTITTKLWNNAVDGTSSTKTAIVTLPYNSSLLFYETLLVMPNGDIIQTAYGRQIEDGKLNVMFLKSSDMGQSWSFLSAINHNPAVGNEGLCEPTAVLLDNGDILCLMRTGSGDVAGTNPLVSAKSTDNAQTWSVPQAIQPVGISPCMKKLANGGIAATFGGRYDSGNPKVFFMIDVTGTGNNWQPVEIYNGLGSSNPWFIEIEPDVLHIYYDISGFGEDNLPASELPNRLVYKEVHLSTDEAPAYCGDRGTFYHTEDLTGSSGKPDCAVDILDYALIAQDWLICLVPDDQCE